MISVIIPAFNEAAVIGRTIESVLASLQSEPGEIFIVCNGCSDDTFDIAKRFGDPVRVLDLQEGSKIAALNAGDEAAAGFPRFYLDADIELSANALHAVAKVLRSGSIHAAAPEMECEFRGASWPVRAFYQVWLEKPYHRHGHVGSGFVGVSEAGRRRFGRFPDIIADDEFVRRQFLPHERAIVEGASFRIHTPQDLKSLVKVKTRSRLGRCQLEQQFPELTINAAAAAATGSGPSGHAGTDVKLIRSASWPQVVAYCAIVATTRIRADLQFRQKAFGKWERDETSRT